MGVFSFGRQKSEDAEKLHSMLQLAQEGDEDARRRFIQAYVPYVLRIASQASRRYIDRHQDDEYSIALMAFNEAIDRFDTNRKAGFLGFAETIIRRRLIDYFRSQKSQSRVQPFSDFEVIDDEDNAVNYVEIRASLAIHHESEEQNMRRLEIEEYGKLLTTYGLSFQDLVELCPKHADARKNAVDVARAVADDPQLSSYVKERQALPLKALEDKVSVSRKTMERQRKYILAVVLLLTGDFTHLQEYVNDRENAVSKVST